LFCFGGYKGEGLNVQPLSEGRRNEKKQEQEQEKQDQEQETSKKNGKKFECVQVLQFDFLENFDFFFAVVSRVRMYKAQPLCI